MSHCLVSAVISSTTYHFKTVGLEKTFDTSKLIFDCRHDYCDILDLDDDEDEFLDEDSENDLDEGENDEKEVFPSNLSDDDDY